MIARIHPDGRVERLPESADRALQATIGTTDVGLTAALRAGALIALVGGTHQSTTTAAIAGVGAARPEPRPAPRIPPRVSTPRAPREEPDYDEDLDDEDLAEPGALEMEDPVPPPQARPGRRKTPPVSPDQQRRVTARRAAAGPPTGDIDGGVEIGG